MPQMGKNPRQNMCITLWWTGKQKMVGRNKETKNHNLVITVIQ